MTMPESLLAAQREAIARSIMASVRTWTPDVQIRCARCWAVIATVHITKVDTLGRFMHPLDPHECAAADLERVAGWETDAETNPPADPDPLPPEVLERLRTDPVLLDRLNPDRVSERAFDVADALAPLVGAWLVGAVQAEHERLLTDVQRRVDHAQRGVDEYPQSEFWRGLRDGLAQLRNDMRDEPVLAVVSRDTRSSSDE